MTFCIEFMLRKKGKLKDRGALSVEFLSWAKNTVTGQKKDGDFFDQIAVGYERLGMVGEGMLPYAPSYNGELAPTRELLEQVKAMLRRGIPALPRSGSLPTGPGRTGVIKATAT